MKVDGRLAGLLGALASTLVVFACSGSNDGSAFDQPSDRFGQDPSNPNSGQAGSFGDGGTGSGGGGDGGPGGNGRCSPNLTGIVRDFKAYDEGVGHPDFEHYGGSGQKKMVMADLGSDKKPVYNPNPDPPAKSAGEIPPLVNGKHAFITSPASFHQWYRDTPGTNQSFEYTLALTKGQNGIWTFATDHFFPIDGKGFGDEGLTDVEGKLHNFGFTFELHTEFVYNGGEVFKFTGDDDLFTFINGKLAIDLGGLHPAQSQNISLDEAAAKLGIVKGKTYPLDVFHAERHSQASNFRIDTTIQFTNCDAIIVH